MELEIVEWVFLTTDRLAHNNETCAPHVPINAVTNYYPFRLNEGFYCHYCGKEIPEDLVTQWKLLNV